MPTTDPAEARHARPAEATAVFLREHPEYADDPAFGDTSLTVGSGNVFADLGFDAEEAASLKARARLMSVLADHIAAEGWTQAEAAAVLGETQPRVSNLVTGQVGRFSLDKLVDLLARVGLDVEVRVTRRAA